MTKLHSSFSASGASRWTTCTGSIELEKQAVKTTSQAAIVGTKAHKFLEENLFDLNAKSNDEEENLALSLYRNYLFSVFEGSDDFTLQIEKHIDLFFIHPLMFGTADAIVSDHQNKTLHVIDFKFGKSRVDPDSLQLKYYAIGACYKKDFEKIILTVIQPRCSVKSIDRIRSYTTNKDELKEVALFLKRKVDEINKGDTELVYGSHCFFCSAKTICREYRKNITTSAKEDFKE